MAHETGTVSDDTSTQPNSNEDSMIMPIFTNQKNLTMRRAEYADQLVAAMVDTVARDLHRDATERDVAVAALARIITAIAPHSGKGHAENMKAYTNAAVDKALQRMDEQVVDMHKPAPVKKTGTK